MSETVPKVDVHLHLTRWWPDIQATGYRRDLDFTLKGLLHEMDGVGLNFGILIQSNDAPNTRDGLAEAREIVAGSGGRLRLVSTVNPTSENPTVAEMLALWDGVPELSGIKLYPGYHPFYPHDRRLDPVYEYAHQRKIPILIHTGDTLDQKGLIKYSRPLEIDEVAVRFRDLPIVLCHFGNPWVDEAAEVVYKNPNTFADTSGLFAHPSYPLFPQMVDLCRKRVQEGILMVGSTDRILYGSDWPLLELKAAMSIVHGLELPERDRTAILGGNATRLYGLRPSRKRRAGAS
ncbi:MAG TPA: amidohydrolase family protein [Thermoplasmata archaeon]|nr:amidohydrolase family protein [Thermoplasmata archaeon]